jgi:hypothetical protein
LVAISGPPSTRWRGTPSTPRGSSYWFFGLLVTRYIIVRLRAFVLGLFGFAAFLLFVLVLGFFGFAAFLLFVLVLGFFAAFLLFVLVLGLLRSTIVCGLIGSRLTCLPVWRTFS